jgi:hypothetical protein
MEDWTQNLKHNEKYCKVHSYLHKFNNWLHVALIVHHFFFIRVEWHSPLVSEDWILPLWILPWWLWNNTPFLQTVEAKKMLRLNIYIYTLSNHHFMNTAVSLIQVINCEHAEENIPHYKTKRGSNDFSHEWRSQMTIKKSISYITITTNI